MNRTALLATAMTLLIAAPAQAQLFWMDEPAPARAAPAKKPKRAIQHAPKIAETKENKPSGPVVIAISLEKQSLKLYDNNGVFAESPVSTGMKGHSTPSGVFSVIGKEIFHRSNIYSGAPMPHMQRITWSGIALHAGVLPGYPASHGCIRLPANFATRLYGWTSKGARVVIAPGELTPTDIAHRNLITKRLTLPDPNMPVSTQASVQPQPAPVQIASAAISTPKTDKSAVTDSGSASDIKLTATGDVPAKDGNEVRTADAGGDMQLKLATVTDTDAAKDNAAKDQTRAGDAAPPVKPESDKPAADVAPAEPALPGTAEFIGPVKPRTGHIAVFVSRKEGKIFVRQNFAPLFDAPVAIAPGDKPLGTHVFTSRADANESDGLRWSVVSLPAPSRVAKRESDNPRRKKVVAEPAPIPEPSSPVEALDRLTIPEAALTRIAGAIAPGGSLLVSDQGFGDETGLGTDFIVTQR